MRATVSGYSDYSYIYAALTSASDFFTFVAVQSSRRGLAENAPNYSSSVYCHKQRVESCVGSSADGNKQSKITSSYHVWGKTSYPDRQTRRHSWDYYHCEYGLFLFGGDIKAADLISYEASSTQKTQDDDVKGFSSTIGGNYKTLTDADKEL